MAHIKLCPSCERRNLADNSVCKYCGTLLTNINGFDAPDLTAPKLTVNEHTLSAPLQVEIIIGRGDEQTGWTPDIDLEPYGGTANAGVSRKHARLVWYGDWQIEDLESSNGTWLDRQRLTPGAAQPLTNGSVIKIGKLYLIYHRRS